MSRYPRLRIIDAFAIHLLLPRATIERQWRELDGEGEPRTAALAIGAVRAGGGAPVLIWPKFVATTRCTIVVSSVSPDLVGVGGEVDEGATLEAEERRVGVAVLLVLADGVAPVLAGHRVLEFAHRHRHAVEHEDEVERVALARVARHLDALAHTERDSRCPRPPRSARSGGGTGGRAAVLAGVGALLAAPLPLGHGGELTVLNAARSVRSLRVRDGPSRFLRQETLGRADISVVAAENGTMPRTVTAPHVDALVFGIEQGPAVSYSDDAPPIDHEEPGFRVALKDQTVRFELKEHYATKDEALERVGPYVRNWEMDAGLDGRPGDFRLEFQEAEVIDRSPPPSTPGTSNLSVTLTAPTPTLRASVSVVRRAYPPPTSGLTLKTDDPDVATMYHRLSGYYSNREPLPSMAYFCLTVLELPFLGSRNVRRTTGAHYYIDKKVLDEIGELSSKKGGAASARKAEATGTALSRKEERFLEAAVKQIIRRAAEVAQSPGTAFQTITLKNLPNRS